MKFLEHPTRNLFFTGKGGVGKTSLACAAAVRLADAGKKVLLVSTDPASNLDEVLGTPLGNHPTLMAAVPGLSAMNLDPEKSAAEYRERLTHFKNVQEAVIDNAGHMLQHDQPEQLAALIEDFLQ